MMHQLFLSRATLRVVVATAESGERDGPKKMGESSERGGASPVK